MWKVSQRENQNVNSRSRVRRKQCGIKTVGQEVEFSQLEKEERMLQNGASMSPNLRQKYS